MTRHAEVSHQEWIAAPIAVVRAQFADLQHHIAANVHPKLRFDVISQGPRRARYVQEVRLLGIKQRDVFEREFEPDGTMIDTSVEGFNQGGSLSFRFTSALREGRDGTQVQVTIRLPIPPLLGFLRPLLEAQVRRELLAAVAEDKHDIEVRGYPQVRQASVEAPLAA